MVALLFILAGIAVLAALFAIVIQQMARARRQHYLEEAAVNDLACALQTKLERKVGCAPQRRMRSAKPLRRRIVHALKGRLHSGLMIR